MAVRIPSTPRLPRWPDEPVDPKVAWVDYSVLADKFLVYFHGKPVPAISSPLNAPGFSGTAVMFARGADDIRTNEIVGVQVIPMLLGAVPEQPQWAVLVWAAMAGDYGRELLQERLPPFLDDVREAFDRYWKPAPPIAEQLAHLRSAARQRGDTDEVEDANSAQTA